MLWIELSLLSSPKKPQILDGNVKGEFEPELMDQWRKRYTCLDGLSGRPLLEESIKQAMGNKFRKKTDDPRLWVEQWLKNAEKIWMTRYSRPSFEMNLA